MEGGGEGEKEGGQRKLGTNVETCCTKIKEVSVRLEREGILQNPSKSCYFKFPSAPTFLLVYMYDKKNGHSKCAASEISGGTYHGHTGKYKQFKFPVLCRTCVTSVLVFL